MDLQIIIDSNIPIPRSNRGRKGMSKEYELGTEIYQNLEIGQSTLLSDISSAKILIRLKRLNEYNNTTKKFCGRIEGSGYRIFRTV